MNYVLTLALLRFFKALLAVDLSAFAMLSVGVVLFALLGLSYLK